MKKFKNRFAVTGDIIDLLRFERELLRLGYTAPYTNVFNYRDASNQPATWITCGEHFSHPCTGTFTAAANSGGTKKEFDLSKSFAEAVKYAAEEEKTPIVVTEDGVEKCEGDDIWYVRPDRTIYHWKNIKNYKPVNGYHFFSTEEACRKYVDENEIKYSKKDIYDLTEKVIKAGWGSLLRETVKDLLNKSN